MIVTKEIIHNVHDKNKNIIFNFIRSFFIQRIQKFSKNVNMYKNVAAAYEC